nr:AAA family ATPase [Moritella viscosa]SHN97600.1 Putative uncharacterized protein [Moritella viscosa]
MDELLYTLEYKNKKIKPLLTFDFKNKSNFRSTFRDEIISNENIHFKWMRPKTKNKKSIFTTWEDVNEKNKENKENTFVKLIGTKIKDKESIFTTWGDVKEKTHENTTFQFSFSNHKNKTLHSENLINKKIIKPHLTSDIRVDSSIKNSILRTNIRLLNLIYIANKIDRFNFNKNNNNIEYNLLPSGYAIEVKVRDKSHNTLKLRSSLKYQNHLINESDINTIKVPYSRSVEDPFLKFIPSWLDVEFHDGKGVNYSSLSSGEKSLYTLLTTIKYHIHNITSYKNNNEIKYSNIVLLLDEVDLGLHPSWQRDFIQDIIEFLTDENIEDLKFHLILTSHSPFIISDMPSERVLFLKDGKESRMDHHLKTFGENIHTLLSDSFFMKNNLLTGSFAQNKITEAFDISMAYIKSESVDEETSSPYLIYSKKRKSFLYLSDIVGDQYLKVSLKNILDEAEYKYHSSSTTPSHEHDIEQLKEKLLKNPDLFNKWMSDI